MSDVKFNKCQKIIACKKIKREIYVSKYVKSTNNNFEKLELGVLSELGKPVKITQFASLS